MPATQLFDSVLPVQSHAALKLKLCARAVLSHQSKANRFSDCLVGGSKESLMQPGCTEQHTPDLESDISVVVFTSEYD